jgi:hypothetical protein
LARATTTPRPEEEEEEEAGAMGARTRRTAAADGRYGVVEAAQQRPLVLACSACMVCLL